MQTIDSITCIPCTKTARFRSAFPYHGEKCRTACSCPNCSRKKRTKSHRDRSTYSITLYVDNSTKRGLSWGRLVLTMLQDYVSEVPSTADELTKLFDLPKDSLKKLDSKKTVYSGYFDCDLDILHLADGTKCLVKKRWSSGNLKKVIEAAKKRQYQIEKDVK